MNSKLTVLLIRNAAKTDFGGAETYPVSVATILNSQGYNSIVVTRSKKLLEYTQANSIHTVKGWWWSRQNWSGKNALFFPVYLCWLVLLTIWYVYLIINTHADVLHIQSKDDFIAATAAGRITGRKVIWTDHMDLRYIFQNIAKPFRNPVGKLVLLMGHFAHHIILISDNEHRLVINHLRRKDSLRKQITIIKNGVIDHIADMKAHKDNKSFTFCLASRVVTNKGIGEAIEAFIDLSAKSTCVELAIYGDGLEMEKFQKLAQGHKDIVFYGHQDDAIQKIADSDVYMLPSYQEGFSIALLEATMLGKPIIASDVDSNSEIVIDRKTGLLVPVRDKERLSAAMSLLLNDVGLREKISKGARKNFEDNFNLINIVTNQIIPLYEKSR